MDSDNINNILNAELDAGKTAAIDGAKKEVDSGKASVDAMKAVLAMAAGKGDDDADEDAGDDNEEDNDPIAAAMRLIQDGASVGKIRALEDGEDGASAEAAVAEEGSADMGDMFAEMMKNLSLGNGEGAEGAFNPEMMGQFMMQMMGEMMSKDHLYEPIKDLATRLPAWLAENKGKVDEETYEKHAKQLVCYEGIVAAFDSEPVQQEEVQRLMIEVQMYGPPPRDLIPEDQVAALDEMMSNAPASNEDEAEMMRQMMAGMGDMMKGGNGDMGCPQQ